MVPAEVACSAPAALMKAAAVAVLQATAPRLQLQVLLLKGTAATNNLAMAVLRRSPRASSQVITMHTQPLTSRATSNTRSSISRAVMDSRDTMEAMVINMARVAKAAKAMVEAGTRLHETLG